MPTHDGYIVVTPLGCTRRGGYDRHGNDQPDQLAEKEVMTVVGMVRDDFTVVAKTHEPQMVASRRFRNHFTTR